MKRKKIKRKCWKGKETVFVRELGEKNEKPHLEIEEKQTKLLGKPENIFEKFNILQNAFWEGRTSGEKGIRKGFTSLRNLEAKVYKIELKLRHVPTHTGGRSNCFNCRRRRRLKKNKKLRKGKKRRSLFLQTNGHKS